MIDFLSVILPTYNPDLNRLNQTIAGLKQQTLGLEKWEIIVVDNNSIPEVKIDLGWHINHLVVKEPRPGLTHARLKGFDSASGSIVVMVDDDNILAKDYLEQVIILFNKHQALGAVGGKSVPLFETLPETWLKEFYGNLALRDLGDQEKLTGWKNEYPDIAPIGAGMGIRKKAIEAYIKKIGSGASIVSDRTGGELTSGGDNDMIIEVLKSGWQVGYFPILQLQHIIPKKRMEVSYLARLVNNTNRSWIQVLDKHQINPWTKISRLGSRVRKLKAWFSYRAWSNPVNYIRWQGACGLFDCLATKNSNENA